jgi:hypothetical protein
MCSPLVKQSPPKFLVMKPAVTIEGYTYRSSHKAWPQEHEIERSSMGHMDDAIDISSIYLWNYIAGHDDQGGIVDKDRVITRTF